MDDICCYVLTVSDSRTVETDKSGKAIQAHLQTNGYTCIGHQIVADEKDQIEAAIQKVIKEKEADCLLITGGTGISERDVTIEVVQSMLQKEIVGFGELFRMISYLEDIGSKSMLSRAVAGIVDHVAIFAMPGSTGAVKLAMEKLIMKELHHVIQEIRK